MQECTIYCDLCVCIYRNYELNRAVSVSHTLLCILPVSKKQPISITENIFTRIQGRNIAKYITSVYFLSAKLWQVIFNVCAI